MRRRKNRRPVVQLTSLLDLLFVMIFVSLLQTKTADVSAQSKTETPKAPPAPVVEKVPAKKPLPTKPEPAGPMVISGVFQFYPTPSSPDIESGAYAMDGSFDPESRELRLGGTSWMTKVPNGYDMVPLKGTINSNSTLFKGRIEFQGCKEFVLTRVSEIPGSPVAGKWEGSYSCGQGFTGLTLTIH